MIAAETFEELQCWLNGRTHRATLVIRESQGQYAYCLVRGDRKHWSPSVYSADELPRMKMMAWTDLQRLCGAFTF